jgi:dihydroflavonol-4-reductase
MRTLITGATGFIGSHLAATLAQSGRSVVALARPGSDTSPLKAAGAEIVTGDVSDAGSLARAVKGCVHVFHVAAARPVNTRRASSYHATNVDGTLALTRAALAAGASRIVFTSSVGVFGSDGSRDVDEQTPVRPDTAYRASKLAAERALLDLHRRERAPIVIARLSSVVGPGAKSWLPFCRAVVGPGFRLIGTGANRIQLGYVSDVVDGLRRCAEAPDVEGEVFIISAADTITLADYITVVQRAAAHAAAVPRLPVAPFRAFRRCASLCFRLGRIEVSRARRYDVFLEDVQFDIAKARRALNYHPRVPTREAAERMVGWYLQQGLLGEVRP